MVVTKMVTLSMNMNSFEWFKGKILQETSLFGENHPGFEDLPFNPVTNFTALAHLASHEAGRPGRLPALVAADGHGTWETSEDFNQGIFFGGTIVAEAMSLRRELTFS